MKWEKKLHESIHSYSPEKWQGDTKKVCYLVENIKATTASAGERRWYFSHSLKCSWVEAGGDTLLDIASGGSGSS